MPGAGRASAYRAVVGCAAHIPATDYADLIAESPAVGFLPKTELSAAGIRRILASE
jgi:hypothetical protein